MQTHRDILQFVSLVVLIWTCSGTRNPLGFLDSALSGTVGLLGNTLQSVVTPVVATAHNNFGGLDHQNNRGLGHRQELLDNGQGGDGGHRQEFLDNNQGGGGGNGGGGLSVVTDLLDNTLKIATNTFKDLPDTISHTVQTVTAPIASASNGGLLGVPDLLENTIKTATTGVAYAVKDIPQLVGKTVEGVASPITAVADPFGMREFFGMKSICESFMEEVWSAVSSVGKYFEFMYKIFIQPQVDAFSFIWSWFPFKF